MLSIRPALEQDTNQLASLFLTTRKHTFTWLNPSLFKLEDYTKEVDGEVVYVAEKNHSIVGFISIWQEIHLHFIHHLFIDPEFQNQGIGKQLLDFAIFCTHQPFELKVDVNNTHACIYYEKYGFKKISEHLDADIPYFLYRFENGVIQKTNINWSK